MEVFFFFFSAVVVPCKIFYFDHNLKTTRMQEDMITFNFIILNCIKYFIYCKRNRTILNSYIL